MSDTDELEDIESAFAGSDTHQLGDLQLEPFTPERFIAANGMGMLWPGVVAQGPRNTILYKGQLNDAIILLWLCTIPSRVEDRKKWSVLRARRDPDAALDEAMRWADSLNISKPNSTEMWNAINKFTDIVLEINASAAQPQKTEGPPAPN